jgi:hypothetical protein
MVKQIITLTTLVLFVTGCATPVRIKTDVQEVFVPVLFCPAPPKIERPELPIEQLGNGKKSAGEIVKLYGATVKVLQGYAEELETALKQYDKTQEEYQEVLQQFEAKKKELEQIK